MRRPRGRWWKNNVEQALPSIGTRKGHAADAAGIRRPQRIEALASMTPIHSPLGTPERLAFACAVPRRAGPQPTATGARAAATHAVAPRAMPVAASAVAARRPTVNRAAVMAVVSALGSFLR